MTENFSDVAAALEHADAHAFSTIEAVTPDGSLVMVDQPQSRRVSPMDLEAWFPAPRRNHGTTRAHTPMSLVDFVKRVAVPEFDLYADIDNLSVIAVLNPARADQTAWQDHRGLLVFRPHPSWQRWCAIDGKLLTQEQFAVHVQECAGDIAEPPALDLLEVAETLTLNVGAKVSSAVRLRDGKRHLIFDESITATAGHDLEVDVPERLVLRVPIFQGCDPEEITVRLMYRQRDGVRFAVQIVDRQEREWETFTESVGVISEALDSTPIFGIPG